MQRTASARKKIISVAVVLLLPFVASAASPASTPIPPKAFITWRTEVTAPAGYAGKLLPNNTSRIYTSVFATANNALLDLSKASITWFVNGAVIESGVNATTLMLPPGHSSGDRLTIRATIRDWGGDDITATTTIRRRQPRVTLSILPGPLRSETLTLKATPFFFQPDTQTPLEYRWQVGGDIRSVINNILILDTSRTNFNQSIHVEVRAINPENPVEFAISDASLRIP